LGAGHSPISGRQHQEQNEGSAALYKPEFWDKVQQLDMWTNKEDPVMTCQPLGIPRHGSPRRIYQTDKDVTFM
jgi:hypothetical protein